MIMIMIPYDNSGAQSCQKLKLKSAVGSQSSHCIGQYRSLVVSSVPAGHTAPVVES
jgi:bacterioferritin-associated ferredoxin